MKLVLKREIQRKLDEFVSQRASLGLQLALGYRDQCLGVFCSGTRDVHRHWSVLDFSYFDLASLTKILSTTYFMMLAMQETQIKSLDQKLSEFFPSFVSALKEKTLRDLLMHRSGLSPIYEKLEELPHREERIRFFLQDIDRNYTHLEPVYSDVGFMLLGILLEQLYGKRLREIFSSHFGLEFELGFGPFRSYFNGMRGFMGFRNFSEVQALDDPHEYHVGAAQDPRVEWLKGDAGHAGLFGTARGVEKWAQRIYRAYHGKDSVLADDVIRHFIDFQAAGSRWLHGFDRPSPPSQSGSLFPETTIGHLGFTGVSFWMDLETGFRVSLLGCRFASGIDPEKMKVMRPVFHDWIWREVFSTIRA